MRLILLGPPGAGKGTQAHILSNHFAIPHISTGDLLREAIKLNKPVGNRAKSFMEKGELVPDEIVVEIVTDRIREKDAAYGFILDGFPRTVAQAEALDKSLIGLKIKIDLAIYLETSEKIVIARLSGRRVCRNCAFNYHLKNMPPKKTNICDKCGGELYQRPDDGEQTVKNRLNVYERQTASLIDYYRRKGMLEKVSGDLEAGELFTTLKKLFANLGIA